MYDLEEVSKVLKVKVIEIKELEKANYIVYVFLDDCNNHKVQMMSKTDLSYLLDKYSKTNVEIVSMYYEYLANKFKIIIRYFDYSIREYRFREFRLNKKELYKDILAHLTTLDEYEDGIIYDISITNKVNHVKFNTYNVILFKVNTYYGTDSIIFSIERFTNILLQQADKYEVNIKV